LLSAPKHHFLDFIEPALATSIDKVPSGERWAHEIKFDGYRAQLHISNGAVKVFTRRGKDMFNIAHLKNSHCSAFAAQLTTC
jgi:bifunctional non-homologous end joining protein LigD